MKLRPSYLLQRWNQVASDASVNYQIITCVCVRNRIYLLVTSRFKKERVFGSTSAWRTKANSCSRSLSVTRTMSWEVMKTPQTRGSERHRSHVREEPDHNTDLDPERQFSWSETGSCRRWEDSCRTAWETFVLIRPETLANKPALKTLDGFLCCWFQSAAAKNAQQTEASTRSLRASNQPSNLSFSKKCQLWAIGGEKAAFYCMNPEQVTLQRKTQQLSTAGN